MPHSVEMMVATETFFASVDGASRRIVRGVDRVRSDHPLVRSNPGYWEPVRVTIGDDVEQATAGPGEKRAARRATAA
jgi:hypothetical protein